MAGLEPSSHSFTTLLSPARLFLTAALVTTCIMGDSMLDFAAIKSSHISRAIVDNVTHGLVGLLSWAVVVNPTMLPLSGHLREPLLLEIVVCGILSSLLDLDHFLAAKSLNLKDASSLKSRPPFHATTIIPIIAFMLLIIVKLLRLHKLRRLPLIFIVAWFSHHIRDGTRRGLWIWPQGSTPPLPYWLYIGTTAILPLLTILFINLTRYFGVAATEVKDPLSPGNMQHV